MADDTRFISEEERHCADFDPTSLIVAATELAATLEVPDTFHSGRNLLVKHLYRTEHSSTAIAIIEPGGGLRPHFHRHHDEIIIFLSGTGKFRIGDRIRQIKAHDVVVVPAGVVHTTFHADTRVVLAAVFTPGFDLGTEDRVYVD